MTSQRIQKHETQGAQIAKSALADGHEHAIFQREDGTYTTSEARGISSSAHSHGVVPGADGTLLMLVSAGHTHTGDGVAKTAANVVKIAKSAGYDKPRTFAELVAKHAQEHGVDRPAATVAVAKTAEGKRAYAESVGRPAVERAPEVPEPLTKSAREYSDELAALAKSKGMRLADAAMTPEGRMLYAASVRASRGGAA